jgi:23S rRNA (cytidine1920-2'-O)/16S rRNA (cytidine1409-2'-O)-methyltransferase
MPPVLKERLDKLLVDRGLCATRAQAQALIMDGKVRVRDAVINKPGTLVGVDIEAITVEAGLRYVSRGGLKLEKAIGVFSLKAQDRIAMDVGASTGGFTDCLLQHGTTYVIAVDVGYGQLDWKLRQDERVQVFEKTNIRALQQEALNHVPDLGVVDTSFISLKKVLPPLSGLLNSDAEIMALLKPQFEYRDYIGERGFKGVVRQEGDHRKIIEGVLADLSELLPDWTLLGLDFSPITGPKGNVEFLLHWGRGTYAENQAGILDRQAAVASVITKSYEQLART